MVSAQAGRLAEVRAGAAIARWIQPGGMALAGAPVCANSLNLRTLYEKVHCQNYKKGWLTPLTGLYIIIVSITKCKLNLFAPHRTGILNFAEYMCPTMTADEQELARQRYTPISREFFGGGYFWYILLIDPRRWLHCSTRQWQCQISLRRSGLGAAWQEGHVHARGITNGDGYLRQHERVRAMGAPGGKEAIGYAE